MGRSSRGLNADPAPRRRPEDPLVQAYSGTLYQINADPPVVLRINDNPAVAGPHPCRDVADGVFLTACNPHSRLLRPAANARRMRALKRALQALGYPAVSAIAIDPHQCWPDEDSFWVPALPLGIGKSLARRFHQNALVWRDGHGRAHLVWLQ